MADSPERQDAFGTTRTSLSRTSTLLRTSPGSTRTRDLGRRASTRSRGACRRPCTAAASGRCASTPGSPPPPRPTSGSGISWSRARPACRWHSTCRPRWAMTRMRRRRKGRWAGSACPSSSLDDMEALFAGLPLGRVSTSMTINATAADPAGVLCRGRREAGRRPRRCRGTAQNDILKEYIARGTYIYPPRPSMRLVTDMFEFCAPGAAPLEHDQHQRLPHARGRRHGGPGARLHAGRRRSPMSRPPARGASTSTSSRVASPSSSRPGRSCSRRSPSSGRLAGCGRAS